MIDFGDTRVKNAAMWSECYDEVGLSNERIELAEF